MRGKLEARGLLVPKTQKSGPWWCLNTGLVLRGSLVPNTSNGGVCHVQGSQSQQIKKYRLPN